MKRDLLAVGLLALSAFLAVALATYHPADPVPQVVEPLQSWLPGDQLVYPQADAIRNACGQWGSLAASTLLHLFGVGAYFLVFSLAVLDYLLLRRREVDTPIVRAAGWLILLAAGTALFDLLVPTWSPGPVVGSGGYIGALVGRALHHYFSTPGGLLLCLSLVAGGTLLCTDYLLLQWARRAALRLWVVVATIAARRPRRRSAGSELDGPAEGDDTPVKIRGRRLKQTDEPVDADEGPGEEDDDWEYEDEDNAEDEEWSDEGEDESEYDDEDEESEEPAEVVVKSRDQRLQEKSRGVGKRDARQAKRNERAQVMARLEEASRIDEGSNYELPSPDLLLRADSFSFDEQAKEVRRKARVLEKTFADFGFKVKVVEIETGPVIAQYEVELEAGLRLSRITGLADDLAIALRVPSVRIVAPIPGKNTVGIEVPNDERQIVRLREVIEECSTKTQKMRIPLFLGKDVSGNPLTVDLSTLPHLLIAGRTGTGKSVCLNAIISSILMTRRPDEVRLLLIDPKMVELSGYGRLPHLMHPVVTDMRKAEAILAWAVEKMEERYSLLARAGVRHISSYNQLGHEELVERVRPESDEEAEAIPEHLPFIVIVADEMADLMMTAGKEVEQHIIRLAQKSRAVGIHLILATQKPTVDVITGLIKSNLPARIAFQVASRTDSRVVLDEMGADKLLGNGDMLFLWPGTSTLIRGQGTYLTDDEIDSVVARVSTGEQHFVNELVELKVEDDEPTGPGQLRKRDELYEQAVDIVVREGRGSVSLLQRVLGIGYGRAARLIDYMAEDRIVGEYAGSQAREVLISIEDWEVLQRSDRESSSPEPPSPPSTPPGSSSARAAHERTPPSFRDSEAPNRDAAPRVSWAEDPSGSTQLALAEPDDEELPWYEDAGTDDLYESEEEDAVDESEDETFLEYEDEDEETAVSDEEAVVEDEDTVVDEQDDEEYDEDEYEVVDGEDDHEPSVTAEPSAASTSAVSTSADDAVDEDDAWEEEDVEDADQELEEAWDDEGDAEEEEDEAPIGTESGVAETEAGEDEGEYDEDDEDTQGEWDEEEWIEDDAYDDEDEEEEDEEGASTDGDPDDEACTDEEYDEAYADDEYEEDEYEEDEYEEGEYEEDADGEEEPAGEEDEVGDDEDGEYEDAEYEDAADEDFEEAVGEEDLEAGADGERDGGGDGGNPASGRRGSRGGRRRQAG